MSDKKNREIDAYSGVETTGHEWDGLALPHAPKVEDIFLVAREDEGGFKFLLAHFDGHGGVHAASAEIFDHEAEGWELQLVYDACEAAPVNV
jgi:hypothetical protein